ncbi:SDR family oxidoreductase [Geomonas subterranea]|uniref:SDR family oxidoreductase n=1 Tax=Geomonas subterranea TaxID=2847989 RepID=A0ABX8LG43_9BACT|nr:glucose 1-dehydrogenase [Geomonas subterranea]QXE90454.1 SDR family oxidoreductase [Geomonas subterranea]QXM11470.1 SDR family oxidoreductase [Geomonas subterranea]
MAQGEKKMVALVTGAARGIGRGIAQRLLAEGYAVVLADIDGAAVAGAAAALGAPDAVLALEADVADEQPVQALVARALERFGRLDLLVNNAALARAHAAPVHELSLTEWNRVIGTNLTGVFLCTKHAVPHLKESRGSIVNIASTRALQSEPDTEAYSASKGGVVALTHALAMSLGPEIRVNCVSPGWIHNGDEAELRPVDHQQHPAGRVGRAGDIAELVLYLASPRAGFITGQNFVVDGGMTRKMIYEE